MEITCYNCGNEEECPTCGHLQWIEGVTYELESLTIEQQEDAVLRNLCPMCGSFRTEM